MFAFLKNLLRNPRRNGAYEAPTPQSWKQEAPATDGTGLKTRKAAPNGRGLELPLKPIVQGLPLELQPCIVRPDVSDMSIHVPLEKILAQLSKGCVKISFGELRGFAGEVFSDDSSRDQVPVILPLGEIIARLNPALIERRRAQKQVSVPEEISSPFDKEGLSLVFGMGTAGNGADKSAAPVNRLKQKPPVPSGPGPVTLPPIHSVSSTTPVGLNGRGSIVSTPTPLPPSLPSPLPNIPAQGRPVYLNGHDSKTPPAPVPPESRAGIPMRGNPVEPPASAAPSSAVAQPSASQPGNTGKPEQPLVVGLASLAETWPEAVRKEVVEGRLVDAKVALPYAIIGEALKKGRISFPWRTVRSWINPLPMTASPNDQLVLDLPLKVVAPLYLARQQDKARQQQKVMVDEDIPNLFFGFPQPDSASHPAPAAPKVEETNYYVWDDVAESARLEDSEPKKSPTPGTRFVSKYATPNEVVSRAASFDGVAGALIALPDGLMVASRLPGDVNGDTLAAFLPQIFGKVSQCTKELRMGDLNNLNFTVGNVPWKIFRVNAIFFAAFGRSGAPLPTAQLAALAAELDHKPRT